VKSEKVFFDANIFNDIFDNRRTTHKISKEAFARALKAKLRICTSCDIATNIYYITAKYTSRENALDAIASVKVMATILPFAEKELSVTIDLMRKDRDYTDFEDTIQYIMALNEGCDVIVTNDRRFVSKEIPCLSSERFVKQYLGTLQCH
jgi:predicted nucleic acid-binding protein